MKNTFWKAIKGQANTADILLYEQIGKDWWSDEGIAAKDFADDLKSLGSVSQINLRINSPGGSVFEGLAMYNQLKMHPAKKVVHIDGLAASMAAYIAMVGDEIHMPENTTMMVHGAHTVAAGNAEEMRQTAEMLDKIDEGLLSILKSKATCDEKQLKAMMSKDTWLTAKDCEANGLCTHMGDPMQMAAALDLSKFKNVPEHIKAMLTAKPTESALKSAKEKAPGKGQGADEAAAATEAAAHAAQTITGGKQTMKCSICGGDHEDSACPALAKATSIAEAKAKAKQERRDEIEALGKQHGCAELAIKAIKADMTVDAFRAQVLEERYKAKPVTDANPVLGMTEGEEKSYSIVKAIREMAVGGEVTGLEKEASEATAKMTQHTPKGFFIPADIMRSQAIKKMMSAVKASLGVSPGSSGGFLIGTDLLMSDMIEILRNKTMVAQLGARSLSGLVGNIAIPRQSGGATAYWLAADGTVTESDQAFAQLGLTPHRLVGDTAYQKELMMQTSLDVEAFVREDLMRVLGIAKDLAAINGAGGAEPLGILNTTGIGSVTFGAAATWAKIIDFETQVATANADTGSLAYLTTPAARGKWKAITKISASTMPLFLWDVPANGSPTGSGIVNGYRAEVTNQVPGNKCIFGNWSDLILADWAGIDVVVNPYTYAKQGLIEVTLTLWTDCGVRHAVSFTVSTDSAAQ